MRSGLILSLYLTAVFTPRSAHAQWLERWCDEATAKQERTTPVFAVLAPTGLANILAAITYAVAKSKREPDASGALPGFSGIVSYVTVNVGLAHNCTFHDERTNLGPPAVYTAEDRARHNRLTYIFAGINVGFTAAMLATSPNAFSSFMSSLAIATPVIFGLLNREKFKTNREGDQSAIISLGPIFLTDPRQPKSVFPALAFQQRF